MTRDVSKVIRHLIALTGADPTKARIPRGKHRLNPNTFDLLSAGYVPSRG